MRQEFGASLSIKQCQNFRVEHLEVLDWAVSELGIKRFRLMSYWDEHEKQPSRYDFTSLDAQVQFITESGGKIAMCLGVRQPRWPESHWPTWSKELPIEERNQALSRYIRKVIDRYKRLQVVTEWQLENEALLKAFGEDGDFDRERIVSEFDLVKRSDPARSVIMTTSTSWGLPLRKPIPDKVGFSYYRIVHNKGRYRKSIYQPWVFRLRARLVWLIHGRESFIHELQAEPWGPKNIWDMTIGEQNISMSPDILQKNLLSAKATGLYPIDLWGLEWWFWRAKHGDDRITELIRKIIS